MFPYTSAERGLLYDVGDFPHGTRRAERERRYHGLRGASTPAPRRHGSSGGLGLCYYNRQSTPPVNMDSSTSKSPSTSMSPRLRSFVTAPSRRPCHGTSSFASFCRPTADSVSISYPRSCRGRQRHSVAKGGGTSERSPVTVTVQTNVTSWRGGRMIEGLHTAFSCRRGWPSLTERGESSTTRPPHRCGRNANAHMLEGSPEIGAEAGRRGYLVSW